MGIYSTFLQRGFDQIIHDVALQNLPVRFCIDRAGLVGEDGPTHHGVFDLTYLRLIPSLTILAPKDGTELASMMHFAASWDKGPIAIRYPRGTIPEGEIQYPVPEMKELNWEILRKGEDLLVLACGQMVSAASKLADYLFEYQQVKTTLVNCRVVKPLDEAMLSELLRRSTRVVTLEENVLTGGFGAAILEYIEHNHLPGVSVKRIGLPDRFVTHGDRKSLLKEVGLDDESIQAKVKEFLGTGQDQRELVIKQTAAEGKLPRLQKVRIKQNA